MSEKAESIPLYQYVPTLEEPDRTRLQPSGLWRCSVCARVFDDCEVADRCCLCHYCGKLGDPTGTAVLCRGAHNECVKDHYEKMAAKQLDAAILVEDYDSQVCVDDRMFEDVFEAIEAWNDGGGGLHCGLGPRPEFIHTMRFECMRIDPIAVSDIIDGWNDGEVEVDIDGWNELEKAIKVFNAVNVRNGLFFEDTAHKVRIPWEDA